MYFKRDTYRGDIILNKQVSVRKDKIHHFEVVTPRKVFHFITPRKVFHFRCKEGDSATYWVKLIRAAIKAKTEKEKQKK